MATINGIIFFFLLVRANFAWCPWGILKSVLGYDTLHMTSEGLGEMFEGGVEEHHVIAYGE